jgi:hypothetical protein
MISATKPLTFKAGTSLIRSIIYSDGLGNLILI